ncbi:MAG: isoamylase [Treponemataceae bacterium]|nr:isoamylase [Treponemataceae bacterium]
MRRFVGILALSLAAAAGFAATTDSVEEKDLYEYNNLVSRIEKAAPPQVADNFIIFTYPAGPRFVGIAFDFENYQIIHPYSVRSTRDVDGNIVNSVLFYLLERPADITSITYRLVIDGLWTADPENPLHVYDNENGITLSRVDIGAPPPETTGIRKNGSTTFIFRGEPGQTVRLAGTFTNWDPWIYELQETQPGFYELSLPLPKGRHYYNYYLGMTPVVDKTNPMRAYTDDGRTASVIEIN